MLYPAELQALPQPRGVIVVAQGFDLCLGRMLKRGDTVAGMTPLLAQRATSEGPRWTRAVGIIPPTPYKVTARCGPVWEKSASRRAWVGRVRSLAILSLLHEYSSVVGLGQTIDVLACQHSFSAAYIHECFCCNRECSGERPGTGEGWSGSSGLSGLSGLSRSTKQTRQTR
jgi:hypothetical protein